MSGSSEVKLGDSVLIVDDNDLVGVSRLSLKASASTATFFNRGLVQIGQLRLISKVTSGLEINEKIQSHFAIRYENLVAKSLRCIVLSAV